jgi:hypothetical protein
MMTESSFFGCRENPAGKQRLRWLRFSICTPTYALLHAAANDCTAPFWQ